MKISLIGRLHHAASTLALIIATAGPAQSATFLVDTEDDLPDAAAGDGVCSTASGECALRAAIEEANALAGAHTVTLPVGKYRLRLGRIVVTDAVAIAGAGVDLTVIQGKGGGGGVGSGFDVEATGSLDVSDATIRKCTNFGSGGAILNMGSTTLTRVRLTKNRTRVEPTGVPGGGIYNLGDLTILDSEISKNRTRFGGGGIFNAGIATLNNVSVTRNRTIDGTGGGIANSGILSLTNVTLTRNRARSSGGALNTFAGTSTLNHVTAARNRAVAAKSFNASSGGTVTIENSIVQGKNACGAFASGSITSLGHNLESDTTCGFTATGDLSSVKHGLGRFRDHGGIGSTIALKPDSPAIDAGNGATCPPTDQRGIVRPQGAGCDLGAYELVP